MNSQSPHIEIKAFCAIEDRTRCEQFVQSHLMELARYKVTGISSAKASWMEQPNVYVVSAEMDGKLVGGVKIHSVASGYLLPVEQSVGSLDPRLYKLVNFSNKKGAGEACGLWNSHQVKGWGVSHALMCAVVAVARSLQMTYLFGISSDHTMPLFASIGYRVIKQLGNQGDFVYPNPSYISRVVRMNTKTLSGAEPYKAEMIRRLSVQPQLLCQEKFADQPLLVNFNLSLSENPAIVSPWVQSRARAS